MMPSVIRPRGWQTHGWPAPAEFRDAVRLGPASPPTHFRHARFADRLLVRRPL